MKVRRMADLDLRGKRVLIREDLNVPVKDGVVTSDARIRASLPTIELALKAEARVLILSHLGRPEEGVYSEEFSLVLPGVRCLDADPLWVDNPAFRGLHSLRLTRVAPAGVTPEGLVESKTRAGAMDGTGSWSTAG